MSKQFDNLDDTFGIVPQEETKPMKKEKPLIVNDKETDREKDYQYARAQLYDLVEKMQETLNGAMEVAAQSDHPRAFEVAFAGAKHTADVVEKIQDLQKKMKDLDVEEVKVQQHNTQNNIYMSGSTNDLIKMLKDADKDKDK